MTEETHVRDKDQYSISSHALYFSIKMNPENVPLIKQTGWIKAYKRSQLILHSLKADFIFSEQ